MMKALRQQLQQFLVDIEHEVWHLAQGCFKISTLPDLDHGPVAVWHPFSISTGTASEIRNEQDEAATPIFILQNRMARGLREDIYLV